MEAEVDDQALTTTDKTRPWSLSRIRAYQIKMTTECRMHWQWGGPSGYAGCPNPKFCCSRTHGIIGTCHEMDYVYDRQRDAREWSRAAGTLPVISELYVMGTNLSDRAFGKGGRSSPGAPLQE